MRFSLILKMVSDIPSCPEPALELTSRRTSAVSLHEGIERLLDQGAIVIVPSPGDFTTPTTWRCLVLNRLMDKNIVFYRSKDSIIRVKVSLRYPASPPSFSLTFNRIYMSDR
jgi:hypothetical protein